jgi:4-aminobutyrate aminotransferase
VEIVRGQQTKERAKDLRDKVVIHAFHKGLLTLDSGENSIRMSPPLIIDEAQADCAIRIMEESIREAEKTL